MKKDVKFYLKLFKSTFYLSAFTFGGGYVIIPLMRKKFVEELAWIEEDEMLDLVAIGQSSPGVMAVNVSILIGYRLSGIFGALITITATILPPLIVQTVISFCYHAFKESIMVQYILKGLQAGVAAVIVDVIIGMVSEIIKGKKVYANVIMAASFVAAFFFEINVIVIIVFFALCGVMGSMLYKNKKE